MISQQSLEDFLQTTGKVVLEWLLGVVVAILKIPGRDYHIQYTVWIIHAHAYMYTQHTCVHISKYVYVKSSMPLKLFFL